MSSITREEMERVLGQLEAAAAWTRDLDSSGKSHGGLYAEAAAAIRALMNQRAEALAAMSADTADVAMACAALRAQLAEAQYAREFVRRLFNLIAIMDDDDALTVEALREVSGEVKEHLARAAEKERKLEN